MLPEPLVQQMLQKIRACPELWGCPVGLHANNMSRVLAHPVPGSPNCDAVAIIIEEVVVRDKVATQELRRVAKTATGIAHAPDLVKNRSRVGSELVGAGLSCGLTVVAAIGVVAGAAAEIPSAGASTFLVIASWSGLATAGIQCANGLARLGVIAARPDDNSLQRWDADTRYATATLLVDAIGLASGIGALPFAARNLMAILARQRSFLARGLTFESLRKMNRAERLKVVTDIFEEAASSPDGRKALVAAAGEARIGVNAMKSTSGVSVRYANNMRKVISEETMRRLSSSMRDIMGTVAGVGVSATPASLTGSGSGSVNYVINLVEARLN